MTLARIARRKAAPLTNWSFARRVTPRVVALRPCCSARAKLPFNAFRLSQLSPITAMTSAAINPHRGMLRPRRSSSRDFVPWRFSDASRRRAWTGHQAGVREP